MMKEMRNIQRKWMVCPRNNIDNIFIAGVMWMCHMSMKRNKRKNEDIIIGINPLGTDERSNNSVTASTSIDDDKENSGIK